VVPGWPQSVAKLAEELPVTDLLTLEAPTDAVLLWLLVRHRLRAGTHPATGPGADPAAVRERTEADPGAGLGATRTGFGATTTGPDADPAAVLASVVADVLAAAPGSRLNLLLTDGRRFYATAAGHALSVQHLHTGSGDALIVASEPFDDGAGWTPVPDGHLVTGALAGRSGELTGSITVEPATWGDA
jgi:gamma-glutamyl hercynylcysteine S-oxide hydrolase